MDINFRVESELLKSMQSSLKLAPDGNFRLAVTKGEIDDKPPAKWVITLLPIEIYNEILENGEAIINIINGVEMMLYPANEVAELDNKTLCWVGNEMGLVPNV